MNKRNLFITISHFVFLFVISSLLIHYNIIYTSPFNTNLILCDTIWYDQIRSGGYSYVPFKQCNLAFFPLFPIVWRLSSLNALGISLINTVLFITGINFLLGKTKYPIGYLLTIISFPSYIFFILPYSESLFFIFGSLILVGYSKSSNWLICFGLLGCSLTRSVSTLFIPAIIFTELIQFKLFSTPQPKLTALKNIILYSSICIIGVSLVTFLQVMQTGKWFYFLKVQKYWGRHFEFPILPFTTRWPTRVIGVDAIGLVVGILALFIFAKYVLSFIQNKVAESENPPSRALTFSLLYLLGIVFLDCFFTRAVAGQTSIWSMNRHIFCAPFFLFFLNWLSFQYTPSKADKYAIPVIIFIGIFINGLYIYKYNLTYYLVFFLSFMMVNAIKTTPLKLSSFTFSIILYLFNITLWVVFHQAFLQSKWVG
jgi:hypothetical protein